MKLPIFIAEHLKSTLHSLEDHRETCGILVHCRIFFLSRMIAGFHKHHSRVIFPTKMLAGVRKQRLDVGELILIRIKMSLIDWTC